MNSMMLELLQHSYKEQLIKAGVDPQRAIQAATTVTIKELSIIRDIWTEWAQASHHFFQAPDADQTSPVKSEI